MTANYNRNRYYTKNKSSGELTSDLYNEIFELRKQLKELTEERDRLRGSVALYEAETARLQYLLDDASKELLRICGGI